MTEKAVKNERAENFVRKLFQFVLDRKTTCAEEIEAWTQCLVNGGDAVDVFNRFVESKENKDRRQQLAESETQYPSGHFYSPVVSRSDLKPDRERVFGTRRLSGINLNDGVQCQMFKALSSYSNVMPFDDQPNGHRRYHYGNSSYGFGDACIYWGMLGALRPKRLIEIGSGYTSALALDAIEHFRLETRCTFIDPYPDLALKVTAPLNPPHEIVPKQIQHIDPSLVEQLEAGDLLFIDSSHVVKTGSDVHFELTELLPRLKHGVLVHFHDIFYPFEYPETWVINDNKSWNEIYFIHAFLMFNSAFSIVYFNDYFRKTHPDEIALLGAEAAGRVLVNPGGGLWLQRC